MVNVIKHARWTTHQRQCVDGIGAVIQDVVDFEHHALTAAAIMVTAYPALLGTVAPVSPIRRLRRRPDRCLPAHEIQKRPVRDPARLRRMIEVACRRLMITLSSYAKSLGVDGNLAHLESDMISARPDDKLR